MGGSHNEFEDLFKEAKSYFEERNIFKNYSFNNYYDNYSNFHFDFSFNNYLNAFDKKANKLTEISNKSFEEIDKEISELIKIQKKYCPKNLNYNGDNIRKRIESWKIYTVNSYIEIKLSELRNARIIKTNREELKNYLCRISDYIIKKEDYYQDNNKWTYLPFKEGKYNYKIKDKDFDFAFHGTGRNCQTETEIKEMIENIFKNGFRNGNNNVHSECDDLRHPGEKVGIGVYVSPNLEVAKSYAGKIQKNGKDYLCVIKVKVKKKAIRQCKCEEDYWVIPDNIKGIEPYEILYQQI